MGNFWDRRLAEFQQPAQPRPAQGPLGYSPPPPGQQQPQYLQQGLAVQRQPRGQDDVAQHIMREGYIKKPPLWVQRQPTDRCPNCGGVNMAAVSPGGYSRPGAAGTILRCFECNWSSGRGVSALWGAPSSGPVVGPAVQSRDGTISLRNTGLIGG